MITIQTKGQTDNNLNCANSCNSYSSKTTDNRYFEEEAEEGKDDEGEFYEDDEEDNGELGTETQYPQKMVKVRTVMAWTSRRRVLMQSMDLQLETITAINKMSMHTPFQWTTTSSTIILFGHPLAKLLLAKTSISALLRTKHPVSQRVCMHHLLVHQDIPLRVDLDHRRYYHRRRYYNNRLFREVTKLIRVYLLEQVFTQHYH